MISQFYQLDRLVVEGQKTVCRYLTTFAREHKADRYLAG